MHLRFKILGLFLIITMSLFLAAVVWQSNRYDKVNQEIAELEEDQTKWVDHSKSLIADGALYTATDRIVQMGRDMNMQSLPPENIVQVQLYEEN